MISTTKPLPRRIGGWQLFAVICLAGWTFCTAIAARDPLRLMLEWELLAVFVRHETQDWYRTVIAIVGFDVMTCVFIVAGAGWLALLVRRRAARFPAQVQAWLLAVVAMRIGGYLSGAYMSHAIGIEIALPLDGVVQAVIAAALGIPYFRWSRRVRETFVNA